MPVMNVNDVFLVLHHHWARDTSIFPDERQRLQLAFLALLSGYTGTRPGALVYVKRNAKVLTECAIPRDDERDEEYSDSEDEPNAQFVSGDAMNLDYEEIIECLCYKHITLVLLGTAISLLWRSTCDSQKGATEPSNGTLHVHITPNNYR
jgi:hypothetical protein